MAISTTRALQAMPLTCLVLLLLQNAPGECVVLHSRSLSQNALPIAAGRATLLRAQRYLGLFSPTFQLAFIPSQALFFV